MVPGSARRAGDGGGGSRAAERRGATMWVGTVVGWRSAPIPGGSWEWGRIQSSVTLPEDAGAGGGQHPDRREGPGQPSTENRRCRQAFGHQVWRGMKAVGVMGKKWGARAACIAHVTCVLLAESLKSFSLRDCTPGSGFKSKIKCHQAVPCSAVN